jgi:uncharacterized protein (TIGR02147 family)
MQSTFDFFSVRDYRLILKQEFACRKQKRRGYSLNAFARDIGFSSSRFSGVLKGLYGISAEAAKSIGEKLNYTPDQINYLADLAESMHARTAIARKEAALRLLRFNQNPNERVLDETEMSILNKWFYPATLELIKIHSGKITSSIISKKLRISKMETREAIESLTALGLISHSGDTFKYKTGMATATSAVPSKVIRDFHTQFLDQTKSAIERVPMKNRKNRSSVVSFDKSRIEEARLWLEKSHSEFIKEFCSGHAADSVFGLGMYLFPMDDEL